MIVSRVGRVLPHAEPIGSLPLETNSSQNPLTFRRMVSPGAWTGMGQRPRSSAQRAVSRAVAAEIVDADASELRYTSKADIGRRPAGPRVEGPVSEWVRGHCGTTNFE